MNQSPANDNGGRTPWLTRVVATFMRGDVAISLMVVSLALGCAALVLTPREEDPQITVPMADLIVIAPGLGPREIERQITSRLERICFQVQGVEHVYSRALPERSITTVRFFVGEDRERALVRLQNEIDFFRDEIPPQVSDWVIKPRDVDDVPILVATFWSERPERYDDAALRRLAEELLQPLAAIRPTNRVELIGGRPRRLRVELDPNRLAAHGLSALAVTEAVRTANGNFRAGDVQQGNERFTVEAGPFLRSAGEVRDLIVAVHDGRPVFLREVAAVSDAPAEVESYTWIGFGPAERRDPAARARRLPAVHVALAKRPGANNVWVADRVAQRIGGHLSRVREVRDYQTFVGTASPVDFNGLVRRYYLRNEPHMASIRVNLVPKEYRRKQSHAILLRLRPAIERMGRALGANVKMVEVPPGPPVLATITGVIHGPPGAPYEQLARTARKVRRRLEREPGVVDVDFSAEMPQQRWMFEVDRAKIRQAGVTEEQVARTLQLAVRGDRRQVLHQARDVHPTRLEFRLPRPDRSTIADLRRLAVRSPNGQLPLSELGRFRRRREPLSHWHQDLVPVAYVYAEVAGRPPGDAIADVQADFRAEASGGASANPGDSVQPRPLAERNWLQLGGGLPWGLPDGYRVAWAQEGELEITLRVFRDLGLAYAAALVGIFAILMFQTGSRTMALVVMSAIPLTLIGIMPGFWLLNLVAEESIGGYSNPVFFTATSMIGIIVLSGVVIRNSVLLIEFIEEALGRGTETTEAIVQSVAVRTRPILLTAATTLVGNLFITLDPIFSGLAWAIIFGIITSNLFTLLVVPVMYGLLFQGRKAPAGAA